MKFSKTLLIALPVAFTSFSALADNPINDQIEAAISSQTLKTVAVDSSNSAPVKARITGDNPANAQIEAAISSQTLRKAPVATNRFDAVYAELQSKVAQLQHNSNPATFTADAQAAKELALQAKQSASSLLKDTGDSDDNYRLESDVNYTTTKLDQLIDNLDSALESAQQGRIDSAKAVVADLNIRS